MVRVAINGASGRMGRRLVALASEDDQLTLVGALEKPGHAMLGQDACELAGVGAGQGESSVPLSDQLTGEVDVVIDFSLPESTRTLVPRCAEMGAAMVIGTTGLQADDQATIEAASQRIAILQAANMSLGVNLLRQLCAQVAKQLGADYDIEIVETHHRFKKDAPSGTAMALAKSICDATDRQMADDLVHGRHGGDTQRTSQQVGMHAIRSGDIVGQHRVSFGALGEQIVLEHTATNRDVFVTGALRAARWIAGKDPGLYDMNDVLGL